MRSIQFWKIVLWSVPALSAIAGAIVFYTTVSKLPAVLILLFGGIVAFIANYKKDQLENSEKANQNKPELLFVNNTTVLDPHGREFNLHVKNYGNSTATDVNMKIKYIAQKNFEIIHRYQEFPAGETRIFKVPILIGTATTSETVEERNEFLRLFSVGEQVIMLLITFQYKWGKQQFISREHTLVFEFPDKISVW